MEYDVNQEFKKPHISRLPIVQFPEYDFFCDKITISIPLFEGFIDSGQGVFTRGRFKAIHCKGAIWTAISIICNTDLADNGVQIMFHIEDRVYDDAMEVFEQFQVPEHFIHKRTLNIEERVNVGQPHFGKKWMCFWEDCPTETWFLIDSDILFATSENKILVYDKLMENDNYKRDLIYDPFTARYNKESLHLYTTGSCAAIGKPLDPDMDMYEQDCLAYSETETPPPPDINDEGLYLRAYAGTQMVCLPEKSELADFMRKYADNCYQDEFLVSMYGTEKSKPNCDPKDYGFDSLRHLLEIPFYNHDYEYIDRDKSGDVNGYIPHLHTKDFGYKEPMQGVDEFFPSYLEDLSRFYEGSVEVEAIEIPLELIPDTQQNAFTDVSDLLLNSTSDKQGLADNQHRYGLFYNFIFNTAYHKLGRPLRVLEIGVSMYGEGSFSAFASLDIVDFICGVDTEDYQGTFNEKMRFLKGEAYSQKSINDILDDSGTFDIIIDDASHQHEDQLFFAKHYQKLVNPGGYMVIEDVWLPGTMSILSNELGFTIVDGWANQAPHSNYDRKWESLAIKEFPLHVEQEVVEQPPVIEKPVIESVPAQMTFHCYPPPYGKVDEDSPVCAFIQKTVKFIKMMLNLGHKCKVYTHAKSNLGIEHENLEIIPVISDSICKQTYGDLDYNGYMFKYELGDSVHIQWTKNTIKKSIERIKQNDIVLAFYGTGNLDACIGVNEHCQKVGAHIIEPGIGYPDCFQNNRIYESSAKMHFDAGRRAAAFEIAHDENFETKYREFEQLYVNVYDQTSLIVPNYFEPEHFIVPDNHGIELPKEPYALFVGRVIQTKGIWEAVQATKEAGIRLIVAGPDNEDHVKDFPEHVTYIGTINIQERAVWMAHALCVICFTHYPGPFEGVHVESWLAKRPVITSNSGVFCETVINGYNGYRVQWPQQISIAIKNIGKIDPENCYKSGMNYCLDNISLRYHYYFQGFLHILNGIDWPEDFMTDLDWDRPYDKEYVDAEIARIRELTSQPA